jgi:hypothetical protein
LCWLSGPMPVANELHKRKYRDGGPWARPGGESSLRFQALTVIVSSDVNSGARLDWGVFEVDPDVDQGRPTGRPESTMSSKALATSALIHNPQARSLSG